jgi:hypothetical protein
VALSQVLVSQVLGVVGVMVFCPQAPSSPTSSIANIQMRVFMSARLDTDDTQRGIDCGAVKGIIDENRPSSARCIGVLREDNTL